MPHTVSIEPTGVTAHTLHLLTCHTVDIEPTGVTAHTLQRRY
jgi:hypothetical protein